MLKSVLEKSLQITAERFIGFNGDSASFTSNGITLLGKHKKRRGPLDFCLGMTLYNQLSGIKGYWEMTLCHYIANIIAFHGVGIPFEDIVPVFSDEGHISAYKDVIDIIKRLGGLCATPNIVSYIDLYAEIEGYDKSQALEFAKLLSIIPDMYEYPPDLVALSLLGSPQGLLRPQIANWMDQIRELGFTFDFKPPNCGTGSVDVFKVPIRTYPSFNEEIDLTDAVLIGEGGSGKVYNYKNKYAVKTMDWDMTDSTIHEYIALKECEGDVVNAYDIRIQGDKVWLVLELAEGDLLKFIRKPAPHWRRQLLFALANIHDRGICELDIKPQNCLIKNGNLLIGDLGSVRFFTYSLPFNRIHISTDYYRDIRLNKYLVEHSRESPFRGEDGVMIFSDDSIEQHGEVDVYAAGLTLIEMETGVMPTFVPAVFLKNIYGGIGGVRTDDYAMVKTVIEKYKSINLEEITNPDLRKLFRQMICEDHLLRITAKQCLVMC